MVNNLVKDIELIRGRIEVQSRRFQTPSPELSTSSQLHQEPSTSKSAPMSWGEEYGSSQDGSPCCFYKTNASMEGRDIQKDWRAERRTWDLVRPTSSHTTPRDKYLNLTLGWALPWPNRFPGPHSAERVTHGSLPFEHFSGLDTGKKSTEEKTWKRKRICFMIKWSGDAIPVA